MAKIKLATVFSGIGAIEQAFQKQNIEHEIIFACDNGGIEIDYNYDFEIKKIKSLKTKKEKQEYVDRIYDIKKNFVRESYVKNYSIIDDLFYQDIRLLDGRDFRGEIDVLVGGSPCQSFSVMGKKAGLNDARGTLFYEFARLVKEIQPKVFIFENVKGLLSHDGGKTWKAVLQIFESLGYAFEFKVLNAVDFGLPQNRKRIFVVGHKNKKISYEFPEPVPLSTTVFDYLEKDVDVKYYLPPKGFSFVTNEKYKNRAKVNKNIMACQKACQQYNWNGNFIFEESLRDKPINKFHGEFKGAKGYIRKLTPRECLRLMGFKDDFKIVVPDMHMYKQSGNSIAVNVLEKIIVNILEEDGLK